MSFDDMVEWLWRHPKEQQIILCAIEREREFENARMSSLALMERLDAAEEAGLAILKAKEGL